jgi:gliding motility-associated-like protein
VQNLSSIDRAVIQQYKWELNGNLISQESEFQFPTYPSGNYILSLYALADNGCSDMLQKNIYIKPNPQANFSYNSPCFGDSVLIKNTSLFNSSFGYSYWNLINSSTNIHTSISNPSYLAFDTTMRVLLNVINDLGCKDSVVKNIKTIPLPKSHFSFENVCVGDTLVFKNLSSTQSNGTLFYSWDIFNDGVMDYLSKDIEYFSKLPQKFWLKLYTRDEYGCKSNIMQMAEIYPKPEVRFAITDSSGCVPFSFGTINNSSIGNGSSISKYKWTLSNGNSFVGFQPEFKINSPGKYTVKLEVTSIRNCSSIFKSDSVIIGYAKTKPEFIVYPEELSTINNIANLEFKNSDNETWINYNDQTIGSQNGILSLNVLDSGWHRIIGFEKNEFGCIDTAEKWIYVKSDYGVYIPNSFTPNYDGLNERFCIISNGIIQQDYFFRIVNRLNEEIFVSTTLNECWEGRLKNGEMVPVGVYIYELKCRTENRVEKFYKGTFNVIR